MRMPKARPQKMKNPDGWVWRATPLQRINGSQGFLPEHIAHRLKPTRPNPDCSPTGLWYHTQEEAVADLNRVLDELAADNPKQRAVFDTGFGSAT